MNTGDRPSTAEIKERVLTAIRAAKGDILALAGDLWRTPELGFKETRTSARAASYLRGLGLEVRSGIALTGLKVVVSGGMPATTTERPPCVAVMGELDAVVCPDHPDADPVTGAAHACGHNGQVAIMAAVATGLTAPGVLEHLSGNVAFLAIPAEEYVEIEYRLSLREQGKIEFLGGKPEFIRLGEFDDIDMAMLVHAGGHLGSRISSGGTSNGFIGKFVRYTGREAHSGATPWLGANALNSAMLALQGINALRETFPDDESIRVHPILTKGGDLVNIVPADVRLETYVRGRSVQAIKETSAKVDRALRAGALAIGTEVEITTTPGFLPMLPNPRLAELFTRNLEKNLGVEDVAAGGHMAGSTDMGDVSHIMPALHPYAGGVAGRPHAPDFRVVDPELAYMLPAEAVALTVVDLLADGAAGALALRHDTKPAMRRREYLEFARSLFERKVYSE